MFRGRKGQERLMITRSPGRHPALLYPRPLIGLAGVGKSGRFSRLRRKIRGPGVKTGRVATVPSIRTTAPITTTLPSLRAAAVIATIPALLANAGTTTAELVAVDASGDAADPATGPIAVGASSRRSSRRHRPRLRPHRTSGGSGRGGISISGSTLRRVSSGAIAACRRPWHRLPRGE